jgi:hypothetical protein
LLRFNGAVERAPAIDAWMREHAGELGAIARQWFEVMRKCGDEVRELLHDGCPVACLGDAPFGYMEPHSFVVRSLATRKSFSEIYSWYVLSTTVTFETGYRSVRDGAPDSGKPHHPQSMGT